MHGGSESRTDRTCRRHEAVDESGDQPEGQPNRLAMTAGSKRPGAQPKRLTERRGKKRKGERQTKRLNANTLHLVIHLPTTATTRCFAQARVALSLGRPPRAEPKWEAVAECDGCSRRRWELREAEEGAPAPLVASRHERMTVRMELTAALHHSAPKCAGPATHDAPRSQKTVNSKGEAVLFELFDEDTAGWRPAPVLEPLPQDLPRHRPRDVDFTPLVQVLDVPVPQQMDSGPEQVRPGGARGAARSSRTSAATFFWRSWRASCLRALG